MNIYINCTNYVQTRSNAMSCISRHVLLLKMAQCDSSVCKHGKHEKDGEQTCEQPTIHALGDGLNCKHLTFDVFGTFFTASELTYFPVQNVEFWRQMSSASPCVSKTMKRFLCNYAFGEFRRLKGAICKVQDMWTQEKISKCMNKHTCHALITCIAYYDHISHVRKIYLVTSLCHWGLLLWGKQLHIILSNISVSFQLIFHIALPA